ncbi:MAG: alpha/beta fold hydrolase [Bacteroidetes bacterium]|nr:alpha/beta fold hydrolase [Bacteroidota bacterium]
MRKQVFFFLLLLTGCARLDSSLYNLGDKITEYKLDNYTGEQDFILDASYAIPDSLIHLFTLASQGPDETSATTIHAIYIGDISRIATDTVILYCHGNKWHMDFYWQRAKLLANTGHKNRFGVLMLDYRGFGLSDGEPTEQGMYADVDAAQRWLRDNGLTGDRLMMYGFSLGSAAACELTAHPRTLTPAKLLLEAPFASSAVMVADGSQLNMPATYFTDLEIDNAEEIKNIQQPLCWLHGTNDNFLSITTHGEVVYNNHNGVYKEAHRIDGADHGEVPAKTGFQTYSNLLLQFITR